MKRITRGHSNNTKTFVSGGIYNPNQNLKPIVQYTDIQQQQPHQHQSKQQLHQLQQQAQTQSQQQKQQQAQTQSQQQKQQQAQTQSQQQKQQQVWRTEIETKSVKVNELDDVSQQDASSTVNANDNNDSVFENGKLQFKKIFQIRKKSSERAREKKIRQNRQLRKAMMPKSALMALNELKGVVVSDFTVDNIVGSGGFTAIVTVNDIQYEGHGISKMSAKNNACEKAIRDIILARMSNKCRKFTPNNNPVNANAPDEITTINADDNVDITEDIGSDAGDEEMPMINLASFAIFKLFSEWERDGYFVPEMHPQSGIFPDPNAFILKEPKKLPIRNELPPNWQTMHPATLLCMMRPGISYLDLGISGDKPNILQRLGVTVDEQEFVAEARSKKIARRLLAADVCNTLFGTNFPRNI